VPPQNRCRAVTTALAGKHPTARELSSIVSAPLAWNEVETATAIAPAEVLARIEREGDLLRDLLALRQTL
jgi:DNA primase